MTGKTTKGTTNKNDKNKEEPIEIWDERLLYRYERRSAKVGQRSKLQQVLQNIRKKTSGSTNKTREGMVQRSCFGDLIYGLPEIHHSGHILHNLLLREAIGSEADTIVVLVNDEIKIFGVDQFHEVTGLRIGTGTLPKNHQDIKKCSLVTNCFDGNHLITRADLEKVYENLKTRDDDLFLKITLVYFLEFGLLGKDEKTSVDTEVLLLVDNLKRFNKYPWGSYIYKLTLESLKKPLQKWQAMKMPALKAYSIAGFPYAFQVWAYEVVPRLGEIYASINPEYAEGSPLLFKWNAQGMPSYRAIDVVFEGTQGEQAKEIVATNDGEKGGDGSDDSTTKSENESETSDKKKYKRLKRSVERVEVGVYKCQRQLNTLECDLKEEIAGLHEKMDELISLVKHLCAANMEASPNVNDTIASRGVDFSMDSNMDALMTPLLHRSIDYIVKELASDNNVDISNKGIAVENTTSDDAVKGVVMRTWDEKLQEDVVEDKKLCEEACGIIHDAHTPPIMKVTQDNRIDDRSLELLLQSIPGWLAIVKGRRERKRAASCLEPYIDPTIRKRCKENDFAYDPDEERSPNDILMFKLWMSSKTEESIDLEYCIFDRKWFKSLWKRDNWLDSKHLDVGVWWLRRKMPKLPNHRPRVAVLDQMFWSILQQSWDKDPINEKLMEYVDGTFCPSNPSLPFNEVDKIAFILNVRENHWVAIDIDLNMRTIRVLDSMDYSSNWVQILHFITGGIDKLLIASGREVLGGAWQIEVPKIPQQSGGDCGVFALMHIEYLVYGKDPNMLTQPRIVDFRLKKAVDFYRWGTITPTYADDNKDEEKENIHKKQQTK